MNCTYYIMKTITIYMLKNKITNAIYIGQTDNPQRRFIEHKSRANIDKHSNMKLYKAIKKYGMDNFELIILEETTEDLSDSLEQKYIKKYNALSNENYNELQGNNILKSTPTDSIVEDYLNGISASKISQRYNVKHPQIISILKKELGIEKYNELAKKHKLPKKNIPIETIVDLIENQGYTKKETSKILGVCDSTIVRRYNNWKKANDSNYKINPTGLGAKKVDSELILKTYSELQSTRKTAEQTGYSRSTVRKYLKKEGIL